MTARERARTVGRLTLATLRRPWVPSPFDGPARLLVHACYHKVGTVWFHQVLRDLARHYGLRYRDSGQETVPPRWADVFLQHHGRVDLDRLPPFRCTHLVRDPRDIAVSGYRYHLWTDEAWARRPQERYGGRTYQEELQRLPADEGLLLEINTITSATIRDMRAWSFDHGDVLELRFEDLMADPPAVWRQVFDHYGLTPRARERGLAIARHYSADRVRARARSGSRRARHVSGGGTPGQWQEVFDARHHAAIDRLCGDLLERLGYV